MSRSKHPDASQYAELPHDEDAWQAYEQYCHVYNLFPSRVSQWWRVFLAGWYAGGTHVWEVRNDQPAQTQWTLNRHIR